MKARDTPRATLLTINRNNKMNPKFKVGQKVKVLKKIIGVVINIVNEDEPEDIKIQNFRYTIEDEKGIIWTVTQDFIQPVRDYEKSEKLSQKTE